MTTRTRGRGVGVGKTKARPGRERRASGKDPIVGAAAVDGAAKRTGRQDPLGANPTRWFWRIRGSFRVAESGRIVDTEAKADQRPGAGEGPCRPAQNTRKDSTRLRRAGRGSKRERLAVPRPAKSPGRAGVQDDLSASGSSGGGRARRAARARRQQLAASVRRWRVRSGRAEQSLIRHRLVFQGDHARMIGRGTLCSER